MGLREKKKKGDGFVGAGKSNGRQGNEVGFAKLNTGEEGCERKEEKRD